MGLGVLSHGIMDIIRSHQPDPRLPAHAQKLLIYHLLFRYPMILHFQKEVSFSKNLLVSQRRSLCILIHAPYKITGYLSCRQALKAIMPS